MRSKPIFLNFSLFFISIIIIAQMIRIAESPLGRFENQMDLHSYGNCVWLIILTMSTVGYGDLYPKTFFGRTIIFFCSIFGVIIVSFMVVTVKNELDMTVLESKAYAVIKKVELKEKLKKQAASIIGKGVRIFMGVRKNRPFQSKIVYDFNNEIYDFKHQRR